MINYTNEELLNFRVFDIDPLYPEEEWKRQWEIYRKDRKERSIHVETVHKRNRRGVSPP